MPIFGWIGREQTPPARWDLRQNDWRLCGGQDSCRAECRHVILCDTQALDTDTRQGLAEADRPAWRLILLGVEDPGERARLLTLGCAEALPAATGLHELEARTQRVAEMFSRLPRWRDIGPLVLDLFHRDARRGSSWLGLHPREFGLLWRLADSPGQRVSRRQLITDVWRLKHEPETNSVEVHISRLRAKLASAGCADMVQTAAEGGYRLADARPFMLAGTDPQADALDRYVRQIDWTGHDR